MDSLQDIDEATSKRLDRLRSMPVDTSRLDAMLEVQIPHAPTGRIGNFFRHPAVRAIVGLLVMAAIAGLIVRNHSSGSVLVTPEMIAQFHEDIVDGKADAVQINSLDDANKMIADRMKGLQFPSLPNTQAMTCSILTIKDKQLACVLLDSDGVPLTLAVAHSLDLRTPELQRRIEKGNEYRLTTVGDLQILMTERRGRWVCLVSELPMDRLIEIAGEIQF